VYDDTGTKVASTLLRKAPMLSNPARAVTRAGDLITWWTGDSVEVYDGKLGYRYTIAASGTVAPLGPATMMAGKLLIPLTGGIGVYDPATGANERLIAVNHPAGSGPIVPVVTGSMVIEQRGDALAVFGPVA
jgi:hypothetical protein